MSAAGLQRLVSWIGALIGLGLVAYGFWIAPEEMAWRDLAFIVFGIGLMCFSALYHTQADAKWTK